MPPPPPPLPDELVEEVLLRLPPDIPASLVRAGLVCKRWRRLLSDPDFRRRFREFHRSPPMLGFLYNSRPGDDEGRIAHFVPTSASRLRAVDRIPHWALDSRHGRVLLHGYSDFVVCVPIVDERLELPKPALYHFHPSSITGAVLCAAAAAGTCDHLDCHRGPFLVVLVGTTFGTQDTFSCVYSSAAGAWDELVFGPDSDDRINDRPRSALVGNAPYFVFEDNKSILEYDLATRAMSVIELPRERTRQPFIKLFGPIELTAMEDGRLGFAREEKSRLCIWSMEVEGARWELSKVIELEKVLSLPGKWTSKLFMVGSAEGVGVIFVTVEDQLFAVDLRSGQATKIHEHPRLSDAMVVPFMNFFIPVLSRVPSTDDGPSASASRA